MTAVKTLAIGALVIGAAVQVANAGPFSSSFTWTSWNAGTGAFQASGVSDPFNLSTVNFPVTANPVPPALLVAPAPAPAPAAASSALIEAISRGQTTPPAPGAA